MVNDPGFAALAIENRYENNADVGTHYNIIGNNGQIENPLTINGANPSVVLISKSNNNSPSGYQGYLYKNLDNGEYYLVHGGSQSLENIPGVYNFSL